MVLRHIEYAWSIDDDYPGLRRHKTAQIVISPSSPRKKNSFVSKMINNTTQIWIERYPDIVVNMSIGDYISGWRCP
jgi:hypothetical protein